MSLKERVHRYVIEHPSQTEDEIADALDMSLIKVIEALLILQDEGKVKSAEVEVEANA